MEAALKNYTTLVLNADFRPLSYYPLSVWPWQLSVKAALSGRVNTASNTTLQTSQSLSRSK